MMKKKMYFFLCFWAGPCLALTFQEGVVKISGHPEILSIKQNKMGLSGDSDMLSTWGDPMLSIAGRNLPAESFALNETPMTGIEIGISQKFPITSHLQKMEDGSEIMISSSEQDEIFQKRSLLKKYWEVLIKIDIIKKKLVIIQENFQFTQANLASVKNLYGNGKVNQKTIYEIQIRIAELESQNAAMNYEKNSWEYELAYLLNEKQKVSDIAEIPWSVLESIDMTSENLEDPMESKLQYMAAAKNKIHEARVLEDIPDLNFYVGYVKRSDIDGKGDFISASISMPLSISKKNRGLQKKSMSEALKSETELQRYQLWKETKLLQLNEMIKNLRNQENILSEKTIVYADNARKIAKKSYEVADLSYQDYLMAEIKVQALKMERIVVEENKKQAVLEYKYLRGEKLQ